MKKSKKWLIGFGILIVLVIAGFFFFSSKSSPQSVFSSAPNMYWYSGRQSSNEVQLPSVVGFSDSMSFFDYRVVKTMPVDFVCGIRSDGSLIRGCCAKFQVYKNGVLIDTVPSIVPATCLDVSGYVSQGYSLSGVDSNNCPLASKVTSVEHNVGSCDYRGTYIVTPCASKGFSGASWDCRNFGSSKGYQGICTVSSTDVRGGLSAQSIDYLTSSVSKSYGILKVDFFTSSYFNPSDNVCYHLDSSVDFATLPSISVANDFVPNVSFGAPLTFRLNISNNWSYPVKAILSVKYSTSNFLGAIDKTVNRSIDVPLGKSNQDFSIDLQGYSGVLYVTPSLDLYVDQSNFAGLNTKCIQRTDLTTWQGLVDSKYCSGVPIAKFDGDMFKVDISPNTITVINTNTVNQVQCCDGTVKSLASLCPNNCVNTVQVNNTVVVPVEHTTNKIPPIFWYILIPFIILILIIFIYLIKRKR